jgi:hypothetical protein
MSCRQTGPSIVGADYQSDLQPSKSARELSSVNAYTYAWSFATVSPLQREMAQNKWRRAVRVAALASISDRI